MWGPDRRLTRQAIRTRVHVVVVNPLASGSASEKAEKGGGMELGAFRQILLAALD